MRGDLIVVVRVACQGTTRWTLFVGTPPVLVVTGALRDTRYIIKGVASASLPLSIYIPHPQVTYDNGMCASRKTHVKGNLFDNGWASHLIIFSRYLAPQHVKNHDVVTRVHPSCRIGEQSNRGIGRRWDPSDHRHLPEPRCAEIKR